MILRRAKTPIGHLPKIYGLGRTVGCASIAAVIIAAGQPIVTLIGHAATWLGSFG